MVAESNALLKQFHGRFPEHRDLIQRLTAFLTEGAESDD
jgi:hypothetical protein